MERKSEESVVEGSLALMAGKGPRMGWGQQEQAVETLLGSRNRQVIFLG